MFLFRSKPAFTDGVIDLIQIRDWQADEEMRFGEDAQAGPALDWAKSAVKVQGVQSGGAHALMSV